MNQSEGLANQVWLHNFVAIDVETATRKKSSICEIGIAIIGKDKELKVSRSWFVQPPGNVYEPHNTMVHQITPEDTAGSPTFAEVWPEVLPYIEGQLVVAHNTAFDMYALRDALDEFHLPYPTFTHVCSCRLSQKVFPGLYNYRLETVCKAIGFPMEKHHRAGIDAVAAARVFLACLERCHKETLEDLQNFFHFKCGHFANSTFLPQRAQSGSRTKPSEIIGSPNLIDEGNYFYNKEVCFTGKCSFGTREELCQMIADIGGIPADRVTKRTQVLVVGQQDYRVVGERGLSNKQKKAMDSLDKGQEIEILSEAEFLQMF